MARCWTRTAATMAAWRALALSTPSVMLRDHRLLTSVRFRQHVIGGPGPSKLFAQLFEGGGTNTLPLRTVHRELHGPVKLGQVFIRNCSRQLFRQPQSRNGLSVLIELIPHLDLPLANHDAIGQRHEPRALLGRHQRIGIDTQIGGAKLRQ